VLEPGAIAKTKTDWQVIFKWEKEMTNYITRKNVLESNLKSAYTIMWGQCSEALRAKVKSSSDYADKSADCDCKWLIKTVHGVMLHFDGQSVAAQAQLAHHMAWLDLIDDGEMVQQSVANWTEAKVRANMRDQYRTKRSFHGRGANRGQD